MKRTTHRPGNPAIAIAYLRVSTEDQHLGPEAQRAAIEEWARTQGVTVAAWHLDQGASGAADVPDRPGLVAALGELRAQGAGLVIVAKRDRLARDVYVAGAIERAAKACGATVHGLDGANGDTPADAFLRAILDAAAQYERALARGRTKAALGAKRARGECAGNVPWGYRLAADGVHLEADPREQETATLVRSLRAEGRTLREIGRELTERGIASRTGRPFVLARLHEMAAGVR